MEAHIEKVQPQNDVADGKWEAITVLVKIERKY